MVNAQTIKSNKMSKKVLFVVTSHGELGNTGESTGYYLGEVTHPLGCISRCWLRNRFRESKGGNPPYYGNTQMIRLMKDFGR